LFLLKKIPKSKFKDYIFFNLRYGVVAQLPLPSERIHCVLGHHITKVTIELAKKITTIQIMA
jgi:hypothetical protein